MAAGTHIKHLQNEMNELESINDNNIGRDKYYVITIDLPSHLGGETDSRNTTETLSNEIHNYAQHLLCQTDNQPNAVYIFGKSISMIFAPTEQKELFLGGSHQKLSSHYGSLLCSWLYNSNLDCGEMVCHCKIIEVETKAKIFTYFSWKIFSNSQKVMKELSNGKITNNIILRQTKMELKKILEDEGIDWDKIKSHEKYGTMYSLKKKRAGVVIATLSEVFDARDVKKYESFIFG